MEEDKSIYSMLTAPIVVLILNALALGAAAYFWGALTACKILFIEICVILSLLCLGIAFLHRIIFNELTHLELLAQEGQVEASMVLSQGRAAMRSIQEKMEETLHPHEEDTVHELIHNMVPMVQLFINKEKNLLRWGMFGWKVANNAMRLINQRTKTS